MSRDLRARRPVSPSRGRLVVSSDLWTISRLVVSSTSPDLAARLDGGLDEDDARRVGEIVLDHLSTGTIVPTFRRFVSTLDLVECSTCDGTGIRSDEIGRALGLDEIEIDDALAVFLGRDRGTCDVCNGEGRRLPRLASTTLDVVTLRRLGRFLVESGGFSCD